MWKPILTLPYLLLSGSWRLEHHLLTLNHPKARYQKLDTLYSRAWWDYSNYSILLPIPCHPFLFTTWRTWCFPMWPHMAWCVSSSWDFWVTKILMVVLPLLLSSSPLNKNKSQVYFTAIPIPAPSAWTQRRQRKGANGVDQKTLYYKLLLNVRKRWCVQYYLCFIRLLLHCLLFLLSLFLCWFTVLISTTGMIMVLVQALW